MRPIIISTITLATKKKRFTRRLTSLPHPVFEPPQSFHPIFFHGTPVKKTAVWGEQTPATWYFHGHSLTFISKNIMRKTHPIRSWTKNTDVQRFTPWIFRKDRECTHIPLGSFRRVLFHIPWLDPYVCHIWCHIYWLVVGPPLWKILVNWDDYSQYMGK